MLMHVWCVCVHLNVCMWLHTLELCGFYVLFLYGCRVCVVITCIKMCSSGILCVCVPVHMHIDATHTLSHTHTQVVHGDSLVSHGTRTTVSSVMDTSFLFLQSSWQQLFIPPSLPPSLRLSLPSSSFLLFLCLSAQVTPVILRWDISSWAELHFFPFPSHHFSFSPWLCVSPLLSRFLSFLVHLCMFIHVWLWVSWAHSWCFISSQRCVIEWRSGVKLSYNELATSFLHGARFMHRGHCKWSPKDDVLIQRNCIVNFVSKQT